MSLNIVKGQIGNALTSIAADHVVAVSGDIYDETQSKYQSAINSDHETRITLNTMMFLTQEEYDAIQVKDPNQIYAIIEDDEEE